MNRLRLGLVAVHLEEALLLRVDGLDGSGGQRLQPIAVLGQRVQLVERKDVRDAAEGERALVQVNLVIRGKVGRVHDVVGCKRCASD